MKTEKIRKIIFSSVRRLGNIVLKRCLFKQNFPLNINLELTNYCNSKCKMCPREALMKKGTLKTGNLDFELFKKIINQLDPAKKIIFTPVGLGEPLMYANMEKILKYTRKKLPNASINLSTNGILLNNKNSKMLSKVLNKKRDNLTVSLNAGSRDSYKWLMGMDNYDLIVKNIQEFLIVRKKLKSNYPRLIVQFLITKKSEKELEDFKKFWKSLIGPGDAVSVKTLLNWGGQINSKKMGANNKGQRYPCLSLWVAVSIDKEGNVYPCCEAFAAREKSALWLGNIQNKPLSEIYNSKIKLIRRAHLNKKWSQFKDCAQCDFWSDSANIWFEIRNKWL